MVHIHNLFDRIPVLENMVKAISHIKMQAKSKDNDGNLIDTPSSNQLSLILNKDSEFSKNILEECLRRYITYPNICIYKVKSSKALAILKDNPNHNSFDYKDGMISDLYVIHDDEGYLDNNNCYHVEDDYILGRKILRLSEFIYIHNKPETDNGLSIAKRLDRVLYKGDTSVTISDILGIDQMLIDEQDISSYIDPAIRSSIIRDAFTNRIIPLATIFKNAIERDLGLPSDMVIVLHSREISNWETAWDLDKRR